MANMIDPLDDQLPARLAWRLAQPLPGRDAHRQLAAELAYGRHFGPPASDARPASVLVCLYPQAGQWYIPLTMRPTHMLDHAGQVSLPGGTNEACETAEQCALREYQEELGADTEQLIVLGRLTSIYVFASNFHVTPCVAIAPRTPKFDPNPHEVARVLELAVALLIDPRRRSTHVIERRGYRFATRNIRCGDDRIWGATAMILAETARVIAESLDADFPGDPGDRPPRPRSA